MDRFILVIFIFSLTFNAEAAEGKAEILLTCTELTEALEPVQVEVIKDEGRTYLTLSNQTPILIERSSLNSYENQDAEVFFQRIEDLNFNLKIKDQSYLLSCELAVN